MEELDLSLMFHNEQSMATIQSVLDQFESQTRIHVNLNVLNWETGHAQLTRDAIYNTGPDVSEIGSTWLNDLMGMNALHPFSPQELLKIGKPEEFIPASWEMCKVVGDERMWAIPYSVDIYLIYYRKDLLRKAGLDEATAFQSHAQIEETVKRLKESGVQIPLLLSEDRHSLLHSMASWIWASGGDFCAPDGSRILFDQPESLKAMRDYFGLLRYLSPEALDTVRRERSIDLFCKGQSALHFHDMPAMASELGMLPEVLENWGIVPFPKPYFLGGTHLVIWLHSPHAAAAVKLVQFLTSTDSMEKIIPSFRMLPPRPAVMSTPEIHREVLLKTLEDVASHGRSYPSVKLWGVVEERLITALMSIRSAVLADPQVDLDAIIRQAIVPVAQKLNIALSQ
jgi:multiple sugar transport system substrate-binding protein